MIPTDYNYTFGGAYNETVALFADGRKATINVQYACVLPHGSHTENCEQLTKIGGRCTCPHNADIMAAKDAIVADARANGKTGAKPSVAKPEHVTVINPRYAHMTKDEIKAAERRFDAINNEGGEGYNPYRDDLWVDLAGNQGE